MTQAQLMVVVIILIFVALGVFGYLFEREEDIPVATPAHEAEHNEHDDAH